MAAGEISFRIESEAAGRRALQAIRQRFTTNTESRSTHQCTYYDTFDWRLYQNGGTLSAEREGSGWLLSWDGLDGQVHHRLQTQTIPAFAWDLPKGPFRDPITRIIKMRRLLPVVGVELQGQTLRILDDNQKTVAFVDVEHGSARDPNLAKSDQRRMLPRLTLAPVKGYVQEHQNITRFVTDEIGLESDHTGELARASGAIGREPGAYSSKMRLALSPDMRSDEATKQILSILLNTMRTNEDGTRADLDSEFLHDFRVAVRRTRTCLGEIKGVFPQEVVDRFRAEFSWLGDITGPTRDIDVYLLSMVVYRQRLPKKVRRDLEPLDRYLREHKDIEHRRLSDALVSDRYRKLATEWRAFLDEPGRRPTPLANAERAIWDVATERIRLHYERVVEKGSKIRPGSPAGKLHRLRIECKKLRYLLEFFRSLYAGEDHEYMIKALKGLLDNLGAINDVRVQQDTLTRFARGMIEENSATAESLMAMGRLIEQLEKRRKKERRRFGTRFAGFANSETRQRVSRMLQPRENRVA